MTSVKFYSAKTAVRSVGCLFRSCLKIFERLLQLLKKLRVLVIFLRFRPNGDVLIDQLDLENQQPYEPRAGRLP